MGGGADRYDSKKGWTSLSILVQFEEASVPPGTDSTTKSLKCLKNPILKYQKALISSRARGYKHFSKGSWLNILALIKSRINPRLADTFSFEAFS